MSAFGFDPEIPAGYQDVDIEMLEAAEAADRGIDSSCEYRLVDGCGSEAYRLGACRRHYEQELRERRS